MSRWVERLVWVMAIFGMAVACYALYRAVTRRDAQLNKTLSAVAEAEARADTLVMVADLLTLRGDSLSRVAHSRAESLERLRRYSAVQAESLSVVSDSLRTAGAYPAIAQKWEDLYYRERVTSDELQVTLRQSLEASANLRLAVDSLKAADRLNQEAIDGLRKALADSTSKLVCRIDLLVTSVKCPSRTAVAIISVATTAVAATADLNATQVGAVALTTSYFLTRRR